ncbi:Retinoid-inducible serine carboxypeptidase [Larimichthys crocea]|uniref:Carboxypeptidase n=1 Tax=Larimichthys crocea TaxID=215358 RepID=A0A6G0HX09_LARCR|nr:Retinoid-inducible serine carboxypeptidase [Larimichthys crocea]
MGRSAAAAASSLLFVFAFIVSKGLCSPLAGKEVWNYVEVRDGAHMFWWLYYADSQSGGYKDLPLVMWLQGGPGGSGSGFGNFEEIGPLDRDLKLRKTSWVQAASVLFVDNPVGTGFSYTDRPDRYATDVATVASDMLVLLQRFFKERPEFQSIPFYIFSESYGGKMAAAISLELTKAVAKGKVKCNFAGVALGDSWISPLDSVMTWGPYLYTTSLLDDYGLADVSSAADAVKKAVEQQQFEKATELWSVTESVVEQNTNGVNFYNILTQDPDDRVTALAGEDYTSLQARRHIRPLHRQSLSQLMNGPIRKKLGIIPQNVTWGGQAEQVFSNMAGDFMRPVVDIVDQLLSAGVNVTVYNGQLDLIVDTMGQELWVKRLKWEGLPGFNQLRWTALDDPAAPGVTGAFYKTYKNFAFYWILKAGHMIPSDQGPMALQMLKMITQQD